jgi:hypothetical protein
MENLESIKERYDRCTDCFQDVGNGKPESICLFAIQPLTAGSTNGSCSAASRTWSVEHEKAKRM